MNPECKRNGSFINQLYIELGLELQMLFSKRKKIVKLKGHSAEFLSLSLFPQGLKLCLKVLYKQNSVPRFMAREKSGRTCWVFTKIRQSSI